MKVYKELPKGKVETSRFQGGGNTYICWMYESQIGLESPRPGSGGIYKIVNDGYVPLPVGTKQWEEAMSYIEDSDS